MIIIQVLHNRECGFWQTTYQMLQNMIHERQLDARLETILIEDDKTAVQHRFFGSPQVLVNGTDIDPMAERVTVFHTNGCRPYFWKGKHYDYPPREMLEQAIGGSAAVRGSIL